MLLKVEAPMDPYFLKAAEILSMPVKKFLFIYKLWLY